jgi:ADP-heptose:LPS heptosyltransferase
LTAERNSCWCGGELLEHAHPDYKECARCATLIRGGPGSPGPANRVAPTADASAQNAAFFHGLLSRHRPAPGSVLEIGGSHDGFLRHCKEQGVGTAVGIEAARLMDSPLSQDNLDVVAAFNVLERQANPVAAISRVREILAPKGIVLLQVPCHSNQGASWSRLIPENLYLYSQGGIHDLLRYCGFEVVALRRGTEPDQMCVVGRRRGDGAGTRGERYQPGIGIGLVEHMGDIVATEPVVRYLARAHPGAKLSWVTCKPYAEILAANPAIAEVVAVECVTDWIRMRRHRQFDLVFDLHINGRICNVCRIPLVKQGRCSSINFRNIFSGRTLLGGSSKAAGLPELDETPQLHIPPSAVTQADSLALPERYLVMHCVSNDPARTWPPALWAQLAELVHDRFRVPVVEVGMEPVLSAVRGVRTDACGLALTTTAEVIRRAVAMVCVHSGFSHMANGCRVPAVVLSGKYEHYDYVYPFSGAFARENFEYVFNRRGTASGLPFDDVAQAVYKMLSRTTSR